jgi:oxygen-independent coproporphyrinogen III oxidase
MNVPAKISDLTRYPKWNYFCPDMAGIYVHIPFCKQACHYCDFHFSTNTQGRNELVTALCDELALQKSYLNSENIDTIYFGGGTPSILAAAELNRILTAVHSNFKINPAAEVTLEANPDDLTMEKLKDLKTSGINRLSIGIQSFDDAILKFLNRAHDSCMAVTSALDARTIGFDNISVDLIYAIPGQDLISWGQNIAKALSLNPEHISAYSLTIEERTVFGKWLSQKKISMPENDISASEMIALIEALENAGYDYYEVSNFAKPGYISRHNSSYWRGEKYLGIGPSAHSYDGNGRQYNISNNHSYVNAIQRGRVPATVEALNREDKINDWILTTLRTSWGTDLQKLLKDYEYDLLQVHGRYIDSLIAGNLAFVNDDALILTRTGRLLADKIASDLFAYPGPEHP